MTLGQHNHEEAAGASQVGRSYSRIQKLESPVQQEMGKAFPADPRAGGPCCIYCGPGVCLSLGCKPETGAHQALVESDFWVLLHLNSLLWTLVGQPPLFFLLAMRDLSSPTRDRTQALDSESAESQPLRHQGTP